MVARRRRYCFRVDRRPIVCGRPSVAFLAVLGFALLAVGCADASLAGPPSSAPFLYLIISPEPLTQFGPAPDTAVQALLLTTGSAAGAPFRVADRFDLTNATGGAPFTFTARMPNAPIPGVGRAGASVEDGNYVLPFGGTATSRGAGELLPFGTYDLHVESEGRIIVGRVVIPARPQPVLLQEGGAYFVSFPEVTGAAAYYVAGDTERYPRITTSTRVQLRYDADPAFVPPNPQFRVIALDSNIVRYISDSTVARSGIDGAFGLFGAAISATISTPWP
jgi:hypothetical protein